MHYPHAAVVLALCFIVCCCTATGTETPSSAVQRDATGQLQFVTIGSAHGGCPVSLFYPTNTNGSAYLAPALCLAADPSPESLLVSACPRFDMAMNSTYLDIPLRVTDAALLAKASDTFRHLLRNRTLTFLKPALSSVKMKRSLGGRDENPRLVMELVLEPGLEAGAGGLLRLTCRSESCSELRSAPADELWDAVEQTEVELELAPLSSSGLWQQPITMKRRVHVANRGRIVTASHASSQVLPAPACTTFSFHRQLLTPDESCRVTVLQRTDRKGHFVMEPMLCYHGNFTEQGGVVRLTLSVRSSRVRDSVARSLSHLSPLSVTFMSMVGAELRVSESLRLRTGWSFETLRLSVDGDSAELRVRCGSADSCRLLALTLLANPTDLLRHLQFSVESQLESLRCSHRSVKLAMALSKKSDCEVGKVSHLLTSYHLINGFLCIRSQFVETLTTSSAESCSASCTRRRHCQAFSVENGVCSLFVFDKCSKSVRDCSCSRRGWLFVKRRPGLPSGRLCPHGYGDDLCGVKYKLDLTRRNWYQSRHMCESEKGLVIMADIVDSREMAHVTNLNTRNNSFLKAIWLGGHQAAGSPEPSGGWSWVSCNLPVDSSLWSSHEPNNYAGYGGNENAVAIGDGRFYDVSGEHLDGLLCECSSPFD